jgi:hypothetical protein
VYAAMCQVQALDAARRQLADLAAQLAGETGKD